MQKVLINNQVDKLLAVGLLLVVLAATYGFARFVYLEEIVSLNKEIDLRKRKNAKIESILGNEREIRASINREKSTIRKNRIFLKGRKPATAVSELQNYVKNLVTRHSGAKIQTMKPYPVIAHDNYSEASVEVRIRNLGHEGLQKLLFMFEGQAPVLLLKEMDIKLAQNRYSAIVKPGDEPKKLVVTIVVSGFFRDMSGQG